MSNEAERILEDNLYDRIMGSKQPKQSFWDHVFAPRHKLKATEKKTRKVVEKVERKEYYP